MTDQHTQTSQDHLPDWLEQATGDTAETESDVVQQRFSTGAIIMMVTVIAVIAVIGYAMIDRERQKDTPKSGPAPEFEITMYDFDMIALPGETVSLKSLRGQAIVINFWASYCIPCQREADMLEQVWNDYRDQGVVFLGVNTEDPEKEARDYLIEYGITYPNAPDAGAKMEKDYRITGIPETFVISTSGEIVQHFLSEPDAREFRAAIDRALEG